MVPVPTRWMSLLSMVKAFGGGDRDRIAQVVEQFAPRHSEKLQYIYSLDRPFNAYIKIASALEKPLKILEASYLLCLCKKQKKTFLV